MPPACTPEKRNVNHYGDANSDISQPGYVTPPRNSPTTLETTKTSTRGKQHMQWLLQKLPNLAKIFRLHRQIGEGTFSAVFLASILSDYEENKLFAIKHLVPTTHPKRIEVELRCLQLIGGEDNVVGVDLCLRENETIVFIMPYLQHGNFLEYVHDMDAKEAALYIKNLLKAVCRVHRFGIIHRDIKPNNFLYDRTNQKFLLVDFGLAEVCTSNSTTKVADENKIISLKRKRENETPLVEKHDFIEPAAKRPALQSRNINILNSTVSHLQVTLNKNDISISSRKENVAGIKRTPVKQSPFKSPAKSIRKTPLKSPYKLDLPPTHSKFTTNMSHQRRLFGDNEEKIAPKKSKLSPTVSISSRNPENISPLPRKTKQFQQNLLQDCKCYSKASICTVCLLRKAQEAPRAGTPGFRPPEVLLKYSKQTTAVDIWAVGVIMICILSGSYPFFRAPDDTTALAEMISLFGDEVVKKIAKRFGRHLICSEKKAPLDLRKVCCKLRARGKPSSFTSDKKCQNCCQFKHNCLCMGIPILGTEDIFPDSAYDLLKRLLDVDPYTRITAEEALKHPFLNEL